VSITPIPELERLLDAKQKAGARMREAFQTGLPFARLRVEHDRAWSDLEHALTDDTIRALLDVAEAAADVITYIEKTVAEFERGYDSAFHTNTLGTTDWARTSMSFDMWEFIRLRKAIDSLAKEADHDRA